MFMQSIWSKYNTKAFYWIMCIYSSITSLLLFWILSYIFGLLPAVLGSMLFSLYIVSPRLDGNWGPFEQLIPLPLFASILCLLISSDNNSYLLIMLGGMLLGYAILIKQVAALYLPGFFIMVAGTGHSLYHHLTFLSGIILANLIPPLYYGIRHNAFWGYLISTWLFQLPAAINSRKYSKLYPEVVVRNQKASKDRKKILFNNSRSLFPTIFLSLIGLTVILNSHLSLLHFGLFMCLGLSVLNMFMRGTLFPHYWLNMVPWLAIFAGFGLSEIIESSLRVGHLTVFTLIGILVVILLFIDAIRVDKKYYVFSKDPYQFLRKVYGQEVVNGYKLWTQIGEFIKETTKKNDKILVCGWAPHILLYSDRTHFTIENNLYTKDYIDIYNRENPTYLEFLNRIYKFKNFKIIKQRENVFHKGYPEVIVFAEGKADVEGFEKLTGVKYSFEAVSRGGLIPVFRADLELTELISLYESPNNAKSSIESDTDLERDELTDNTDPPEPVRTDNPDWDTALRKAKQLLKADPYNIETLLVLGDCLIGSGNYKLLFSFYNRLMENKAVSSISRLKLLNKLGEAYCNQNKFNEAEELFHKILNLNSNNPTVFNNLGFIYSQQNNNQKASAYFQKALELDPDNESALFNLEQIQTQYI
jgi:tetratricopeptide (TPR) repeat protein